MSFLYRLPSDYKRSAPHFRCNHLGRPTGIFNMARLLVRSQSPVVLSYGDRFVNHLGLQLHLVHNDRNG